MKNTIVLIGAGSVNFGLGTLGAIFKSPVLKGSHVVLHDINPVALEKVQRIAARYIEKHQLDFTLGATIDRKEALKGANFCIISIEVGYRFDLWEKDWQIPQQYGFHQVYGENGGPGGLFHSLRIIPPILEICEDIMAICPNAQVMNLSNPMSRICLTVKRKFPAIRLVGLCHEIDSLPRILPFMLDTPYDNLDVVAAGLNHFSVVLSARYKDSGKDAYPDIREKAPEFFSDRHERGLFMDILKVYGLMPITTDSHFGEYIHWAHNSVDHKGIIDFYNHYKKWCLGPQPDYEEGLPMSSMPSVISIMEAMVSGVEHYDPAVNLLNDGLITNLPADLVVEVPARIDKNGVHGLSVGAMPKAFAALLSHEAIVHDMTAEAVLSGSKHAVLQALLADPVVTNLKNAEQLVDVMIELQSPYLDYLK
ncbi:MAG TPA: alpha-glucosidase [Anaerolineaceae bacterium]